jgi:SOS response regulatory protein OraA/RecX
MESRPLGARGLRRELILKGVSSSLAEEAINEVFAAENEHLVIKRLVIKRVEKGHKITGPKEIRRMKDFLARRGFSMDTINHVLSSLEGKLGDTLPTEEWDNTSQIEDPSKL